MTQVPHSSHRSIPFHFRPFQYWAVKLRWAASVICIILLLQIYMDKCRMVTVWHARSWDGDMREAEALTLVFIQKGQTNVNRFKIFIGSSGTLTQRFYFIFFWESENSESSESTLKQPNRFLLRKTYFPDMGIKFSVSGVGVFCLRVFKNRCQGLINTWQKQTEGEHY